MIRLLDIHNSILGYTKFGNIKTSILLYFAEIRFLDIQK